MVRRTERLTEGSTRTRVITVVAFITACSSNEPPASATPPVVHNCPCLRNLVRRSPDMDHHGANGGGERSDTPTARIPLVDNATGGLANPSIGYPIAEGGKCSVMTNEPAKKAVRPTASVAKKHAGPTRGATKKTLKVSGGAERESAAEDPRPLKGYASILVSYTILAGGLTLGLRRKRFRLKSLSPMDLVLYALATEHLSRVITKDSLTSVLRAPFTRFDEPAGEGEVNEEVIGTGVRHAVGELLTCPFCVAQWVATGLVAGSVAMPALTTAVVSISAAARTSDYLDLLYGLLRQAQ